MKYKPVSSVDITTITTTGASNGGHNTATKSGGSYELVDENDMVHA